MRTIPPNISDIVNYNTMPQCKLFLGFSFVPAATLAAGVKVGRVDHPSIHGQAICRRNDVQIFAERAKGWICGRGKKPSTST
jgi:hypothetical protein